MNADTHICMQTLSHSRRQFLIGAAVAAASGFPALAHAAPPGGLIDVHHHFEPSGKNNDGASWSIARAVEELDRNHIATAVGWSGVIFGPDVQANRKRAREINDWGAQICRDHPGRFGLFASLPMTDVDGALAEIAYAFDTLKANGVGIGSDYGDAWLGDEKFEPIFQELNRRKAVVFVHPIPAPCCMGLSYEKPLVSSAPDPRIAAADAAAWLEFPVNTARTILSLWESGTTRHLPDIRFLFSHGGGVMPILLGRLAGFSDWEAVGPEGVKKVAPDGFYAAFRKLHFECAQAYAPETMAMLRHLVPASHLLFGSDYSYFPIAHSVDQFAKLALPREVRGMIGAGNAATLIPGLPNGTHSKMTASGDISTP